MDCITSPCPVLSLAQPQRSEAQKFSQLRSSWFWRGSSIDPNGAYTIATCTHGALPRPCRRASLHLVASPHTLYLHICTLRVDSEWGNRPTEPGLWRDSAPIGASLSSQRVRSIALLGSLRRMSVRTRAFNPQNGGNGGPGRVILNLAERALIKGPCPNCGGEFQAFEFMLQDEYRFCPYCSQPFKLENKKFVRDEPQFSNQQTRGFKQPFGGFKGFGGFDDFDQPTSSRKREDSSGGVIVDVEAEVRDKD